MTNNFPNHINHALVEKTRPPYYAAMKYWGKKPHNIWSQFIESYCPENGVVLDPFAGSGVSAIEAIQLKRKVLCFDLNPMTTFFIDVLTSKFDEQQFMKYLTRIQTTIMNDPIYKEHFTRMYKEEKAVVYNYRWVYSDVDEVIFQTESGIKKRLSATQIDKKKAEKIKSISIPYWYPDQKFPENPSINHKFISDIGGDSIHNLWTRRNLYILSYMFDEILKIKESDVKLQLLAGFVKTVHLTFKMNYPRSKSANRDFSGSWGRADYMIRKKSMEQNPLVVFHRACVGRQSICSSMKDAQKRIPSNLKKSFLNERQMINTKADVNYGILDVADLAKFVKSKSVDFIITDPPYAGLVDYIDLSLVWLCWLQKFDNKFVPDPKSEITIKKNYADRDQYRLRINNAFKQMHGTLKDDGYLVVTFHHKKIQEWNDFVNAVKISGFKFDKVTHQYNRRTGESNVADPYGTSGADFYIRCVKHREVDFSDDKSGLKYFIKQKAIDIISQRNEPTPFTFIIAGLIPEMIQAGYITPNEYSEEIEKILKENTGEAGIFTIELNSNNTSGDLWWFREPAKHINYPDLPLSDRVNELIISILRRKISVKLDDVIGELYQKYPNGLTPDTRNITKVLEKYAHKSSRYWKIRQSVIQVQTKHIDLIGKICKIGKKGSFLIYIGKREQPEAYESGKLLKELSDFDTLDVLAKSYNENKLQRIEMIDVIWLSKENNTIECIFEVENSTTFFAAIQRASNIENTIPKFMIIPKEREAEIKKIKDPLFVESFQKNNWRYLTYYDVEKIATAAHPTVMHFTDMSKGL